MELNNIEIILIIVIKINIKEDKWTEAIIWWRNGLFLALYKIINTAPVRGVNNKSSISCP